MAKRLGSLAVALGAVAAVVAAAHAAQSPGAGPGTPTLVLLAMDWPDGASFSDFLGFAILRSPGFHPGEKDGFLHNKISFTPPVPNAQSLPSNLAPFQKFLWWDAGIQDSDRGKTFKYTITPVRGTTSHKTSTPRMIRRRTVVGFGKRIRPTPPCGSAARSGRAGGRTCRSPSCRSRAAAAA